MSALLRDACPKCREGALAGPRYGRHPYTGAECLHYTCSTCGYAETRPTKDNAEPSAEDIVRRFIGSRS